MIESTEDNHQVSRISDKGYIMRAEVYNRILNVARLLTENLKSNWLECVQNCGIIKKH